MCTFGAPPYIQHIYRTRIYYGTARPIQKRAAKRVVPEGEGGGGAHTAICMTFTMTFFERMSAETQREAGKGAKSKVFIKNGQGRTGQGGRRRKQVQLRVKPKTMEEIAKAIVKQSLGQAGHMVGRMVAWHMVNCLQRSLIVVGLQFR